MQSGPRVVHWLHQGSHPSPASAASVGRVASDATRVESARAVWRFGYSRIIIGIAKYRIVLVSVGRLVYWLVDWQVQSFKHRERKEGSMAGPVKGTPSQVVDTRQPSTASEHEGSYPAELTADQFAWLQERAAELRRRWAKHAASLASKQKS